MANVMSFCGLVALVVGTVRGSFSQKFTRLDGGGFGS